MNVRDVGLIIPAYGQVAYTHSVVGQLRLELEPKQIIVVDSLGDYVPITGERVMQPLRRASWVSACNLGLEVLRTEIWSAYCLLNNDVRLSNGFMAGLCQAAHASGGAVIAPVYDHTWRHQWPSDATIPADPLEYTPDALDVEVPFADGTCLFLGRDAVEDVGVLDEIYWPRYGWGCDKDYAIRLREKGFRCYVTNRSFLSHDGRGTAALDPAYSDAAAQAEEESGLVAKWGANWADQLFQGFPGAIRSSLSQAEAVRLKRA